MKTQRVYELSRLIFWISLGLLFIGCYIGEAAINQLLPATQTAIPSISQTKSQLPNTPPITSTPRPTFTLEGTSNQPPKASAPASPTSTATPIATRPPTPTQSAPIFRQLTSDDCCTNPFWSADSGEIRFIDQNPLTQEVGIWRIVLDRPNPPVQFWRNKVGIYSPDERYFVIPERRTGFARFEDLQTGETWSLYLHETQPFFTPDSTHILWVETDPNTPFEFQTNIFWQATVRGENQRIILRLRRGTSGQWLDDSSLLVSTSDENEPDREPDIIKIIYYRFSLLDQSLTELFRAERPRGLSLNPAKTRLVYYTLLAREPENNGLWHIDLTQPRLQAEKLPFLGAYQWQNSDQLIYIPFDPEAESHFFYRYDLQTGQTQQLTDETQPLLTVANNDWHVSPDGDKIIFMASRDRALAGLWVIEGLDNEGW